MDTEWVEDIKGVGAWRICRNPICYRCDIIDKAEMEVMTPVEKGPTIMYIGMLKAESYWAELNVKQRIGKIGQFLMSNRTERLELGAIILTAEEAKEAMEGLHFGVHHMDSPRMRSDRNFRISATRACDPDYPQERPGFKIFKRCDIRDTASYFQRMGFMERVQANIYTLEGAPGTFREHPVEVTGTILESILGLGAIFERHGFKELKDLPEMVAMLEEGLKRQRTDFISHRMRKKEWNWDEYDDILGFEEVPAGYPDYQMHADALRDRHERGVPTLIDERDHSYFYARMERRRESRRKRGVAD
eukprot:14842389-Heterocapsa_arctica.AAC.1